MGVDWEQGTQWFRKHQWQNARIATHLADVHDGGYGKMLTTNTSVRRAQMQHRILLHFIVFFNHAVRRTSPG